MKPVFDFVKQQKQLQGSDLQDWRYTDWLENLRIELVTGTSVLELAYKDTDKNLVLPVIQKISKPTNSIPVAIANGASNKPSNTLTNRLIFMARKASNPSAPPRNTGSNKT